ncbi:MAG: sugar transferase [Solirubrobacteraceae bacterium]
MSTVVRDQVPTKPRPLWAAAFKRLIDIAGAAVGMLLLSPLMAAISVAVLICDGWPILYPWRVVGEGGRPFVGYKFRTMVREAERLQEELAEQNEMRGPVFKMRGDPRVTRLGRLLRRASLDELPQLVSVLRGDMSLVGPRPPLVSEYERFTPFQRRKLAVKPGITCLWQVSGRSEITDFDAWVQLDMEYIENWSTWLDLKILGRTAIAVVAGKGAM